jgi:homoserine dehydrogenase
MSQPRIEFAKDAAEARKRRRTVGLAIVGLGTVGTGTVNVLDEHQDEIERRLGCKLELKTICSLGIRKKDVASLGGQVKTTVDWHEVVRDPEIGIIVELVGVLSVARAIASAAIDPGKHLVTANKQLVAECGVELAEHAVRRDHGWPPTNRCWRRKAG